jgi:hypothetical protein
MANDNEIIARATIRMNTDIDEVKRISDAQLVEACEAYRRTRIRNFPRRIHDEERQRRGI